MRDNRPLRTDSINHHRQQFTFRSASIPKVRILRFRRFVLSQFFPSLSQTVQTNNFKLSHEIHVTFLLRSHVRFRCSRKKNSSRLKCVNWKHVRSGLRAIFAQIAQQKTHQSGPNKVNEIQHNRRSTRPAWPTLRHSSVALSSRFALITAVFRTTRTGFDHLDLHRDRID
jgi:hypothetical protein